MARHTTPEILHRACPPFGKMGLDHCAHRFTSQFGLDKSKKETCSRAFGVCRTWQEALAEVHDFLWGKFLQSGKTVPGTVLQVPGVVPAHVMSDMAEIISSLPERKQYGGAKSK